MTDLEKTLAAVGDYATLTARGEHYLHHSPEKALWNIVLTCQRALAELTPAHASVDAKSARPFVMEEDK
jgi:hypothetical protein